MQSDIKASELCSVQYTTKDIALSLHNALTLLVGRQEGHLACKKLGVGFDGGDDLTGALHDL